MSRATVDTAISPKDAPTISGAEADAGIAELAARRPDLPVRHPLFETRRNVGVLTTTSTAEQRRIALLALADEISYEDRHNGTDKPYSPVIDLLVPTLASHLCADPIGAFNQLVAARSEFSLFCADETDYAVRHDWGTTAEALSNLFDRLQADIDHWADVLLGRQS